jgi:hypothetical protein
MTTRELYEQLNNLNYKIKGEIILIIAPYAVEYNDELVQTGS